MSGVTEAVPVVKCLPGIVQVMQKLPLRLVRMISPLMDSSLITPGEVHAIYLFWHFIGLHTVIANVPVAILTENAPQLIRDQVAAICHQHHNGPDAASMVTKEKPLRTTVFHELLESELLAHEKSEERLTQEGVGGGGFRRSRDDLNSSRRNHVPLTKRQSPSSASTKRIESRYAKPECSCRVAGIGDFAVTGE